MTANWCRNLQIATWIVVALSAACSYGQQVQNLTYIPIKHFGLYDVTINPVEANHNLTRISPELPLTSAEQSQVEQAVIQLPDFPAFVYSGCDNRAHATWLLLPKNLRPKLMKVWVVSAGKYTETIPGTIGITKSGPYKDLNWGFHVAVAYRSVPVDPAHPTNGLMVIDSALNPHSAITADQWFSEMTFTPLTFWTLTTGDVYGFYPVKSSFMHYGHINSDADGDFMGGHYGYEGPSLEGGWIPLALARDAVGVKAIANGSCPLLNAMIQNPQSLQDTLAGTAPLPTECQSSLSLFNAERTRWTTLLASTLQP